MKRFVKAFLWGAGLGIAVSLCCWFASFRWGVLFGSWTVCIWPSSIFLLVTDGHEREFSSYLVVAGSVLANAALYGIIVAIGCAIYRRACFRKSA